PGKTRPLGRRAADDPEGAREPGPVPRPDGSGAERLAAQHPGQHADRRPASVQPGPARRGPGVPARTGAGGIVGPPGGLAGGGPVVAERTGHTAGAVATAVRGARPVAGGPAHGPGAATP